MRDRHVWPGVALLLLTACNAEPNIQKPSTTATNDAVNQLSANISEQDGAITNLPLLDAKGVGEAMRTAPAHAPGP